MEYFNGAVLIGNSWIIFVSIGTIGVIALAMYENMRLDQKVAAQAAEIKRLNRRLVAYGMDMHGMETMLRTEREQLHLTQQALQYTANNLARVTGKKAVML